MAGNPNVAQGSLNRVRGSLVFASFSSLNITAPFLGKGGISLQFQTPAGQLIGTMTGGITSPEVVQQVMVTAHINKTQTLAAVYKAQIESLCNIGDFTFIPDASTLPNYQLVNGVLQNDQEIDTTGTNPDFIVKIMANYQVNSQLFNGV